MPNWERVQNRPQQVGAPSGSARGIIPLALSELRPSHAAQARPGAPAGLLSDPRSGQRWAGAASSPAGPPTSRPAPPGLVASAAVALAEARQRISDFLKS